MNPVSHKKINLLKIFVRIIYMHNKSKTTQCKINSVVKCYEFSMFQKRILVNYLVEMHKSEMSYQGNIKELFIKTKK